MYFDNIFDNRQPPRPQTLRKPPKAPARKPPKAKAPARPARPAPSRKPPKTPAPARQAQRKCPSGFYFDKKKGKCVQAGVGPQFKP
tara:strand:+ start:1083 stop:1340 length:258 start_codon:yes stop_codon:yes gene_type:complete